MGPTPSRASLPAAQAASPWACGLVADPPRASRQPASLTASQPPIGGLGRTSWGCPIGWGLTASDYVSRGGRVAFLFDAFLFISVFRFVAQMKFLAKSAFGQ
jgi:hypothetical protein